jgi:aspartate racemase
MEAPPVMGEHRHPEITMHTHPLSDYMVHIRSGAWGKVAELMLSSADKVHRAGADFAVCPDNTIHQAFDFVEKRSPVPWLHIAHSVAEEALRRGFKKLAVLGTKYLMTGPVYPDALGKYGIGCQIPDAETREHIDQIIFTDLVNAVFTETSRSYFNGVMAELKKRGCDAAVLGCTEIPLLVNPDDSPLPTLDSTRLLARAALRKALAEEKP